MQCIMANRWQKMIGKLAKRTNNKPPETIYEMKKESTLYSELNKDKINVERKE